MKTATFMMGGVAAGKTHCRELMMPGVKVLDADVFKKEHPEYDPKNCGGHVHRYSMQRLHEEFEVALEGSEDFVLDGTGINSERTVSQIDAARKAGFVCRVFCVTTSLAECLKRNEARERTVNSDIVREKNPLVKYSFQIVRKFADEILLVDNTGSEPVILEEGNLCNER